MLRLRTEIFVKAWLRRCQAAGAFAAVARKGDPDGGIIIVKAVNAERQARAFIETFSETPDKNWRAMVDGFLPEHEVDTRIKKESEFDRDLWVLEVEDRAGRSFLDGVD